MLDDATLHGRVPDHAFHPAPDTCVAFYEARAAATIAAFNDQFINNPSPPK
jgi:hypothetical protein